MALKWVFDVSLSGGVYRTAPIGEEQFVGNLLRPRDYNQVGRALWPDRPA